MSLLAACNDGGSFHELAIRVGVCMFKVYSTLLCPVQTFVVYSVSVLSDTISMYVHDIRDYLSLYTIVI